MNINVRFKTSKPANTAQLPNDLTELGVQGVNFKDCFVNTSTMVLNNPGAANNSNKGSIIPSIDTLHSKVNLETIVEIAMPDTIDGTSINYFSFNYNNIGIDGDIVGIIPLGVKRDETNTVASFLYHPTILSNLTFNVSKNRLFICVPNKGYFLEFDSANANLVAADTAALLTLINNARKPVNTYLQGTKLVLKIIYVK